MYLTRTDKALARLKNTRFVDKPELPLKQQEKDLIKYLFTRQLHRISNILDLIRIIILKCNIQELIKFIYSFARSVQIDLHFSPKAHLPFLLKDQSNQLYLLPNLTTSRVVPSALHY